MCPKPISKILTIQPAIHEDKVNIELGSIGVFYLLSVLFFQIFCREILWLWAVVIGDKYSSDACTLHNLGSVLAKFTFTLKSVKMKRESTKCERAKWMQLWQCFKLKNDETSIYRVFSLKNVYVQFDMSDNESV